MRWNISWIKNMACSQVFMNICNIYEYIYFKMISIIVPLFCLAETTVGSHLTPYWLAKNKQNIKLKSWIYPEYQWITHHFYNIQNTNEGLSVLFMIRAI